MVRYSKELTNETKVAKARGSHIRIHFKHCREIGQAIKGRTLKDAQQYLENVLQFKDAIPFTKYTGGIGRHSIGKKYKAIGDKVSWPQKATRVFLDLLRNIESNADHKPFPNKVREDRHEYPRTPKDIDVEKLVITHVNCNQAPKMRRRTYRAHGRINAYMSSPAHIEIVAEEQNEEVAKEEDSAPAAVKFSRKQLARGRVPVGGDN